MKRGVIQVKFMIVNTANQVADSGSDTDTDIESVSDVLAELKEQMRQVDTASKALDSHVVGLYHRAKLETVDWMNEPLRPRHHIQKWCALHGLPSSPTVTELTDKCFSVAKSMDLESRVITFYKEDAAILWGGKRRITVFDMIARIPTLFE